jgi:glutathione S-transferase
VIGAAPGSVVHLPALYSFRRCPYAIRARMAVLQAGIQVALREVVLRNKPQAMLEASPKGTVPVLVQPDGEVIDESLAIMRWALTQHDPEGWLRHADEPEQHDLVALNDGPFKQALDGYKYPERHADQRAAAHRAQGEAVLVSLLEQRLGAQPYLAGAWPGFSDAALFPFVRQWAAVDPTWFEASPWSGVKRWLHHWQNSPAFVRCMDKHAPWQAGQAGVPFPG